MIIRTKNLRDLSKCQIASCADDEKIQLWKRAVVSYYQILPYIDVSCRYRFQIAKEIMFLLNAIFKYYEIVPNFCISDYSLQPTQIITNQLIQ